MEQLTSFLQAWEGLPNREFLDYQFAGGFINAETVQSHQIGGNIYEKDNE